MGHSNIPSWASFFSEEQYRHFENAISQYMGHKNISFKIDDGAVFLDSELAGIKTLGLTNVAQVCCQNDTVYYPEIVKDHFERLIRSREFEKEFEKIVEDYEKVKKYLGTRLYHKDYIKQTGEGMWLSNEIARDVIQALIFDLPDTVMNVKPEQIANWNKSEEELFQEGKENIQKNYPLEISEEQITDFNIWFVQSEHFFAPNIVLDIASHNEFLGTQGALIGMPHRHAVIIYPINSLEVVKVINTLIPIIQGMNNEGPGSLSPHLYWYRKGQIQDLPYELDGEQLRFIPPKEFIDALNTLK